MHISAYKNGAQNGAPQVHEPKIPSKIDWKWILNFFSQHKITAQGAPFWAPFFHIRKVWNVSFHWGKIKVIAILEHFLGLFEIGLLSNLIFRDSELHFGAPKMSCLAVFWKFLRRHFKNKYKMMYLSYWFDFLFQEKFRVCFFEFQSLSKNGAQNGAPLLFKFSNSWKNIQILIFSTH